MNNEKNETIQTIPAPIVNVLGSDIWNGSDDNCQGQYHT